MSEAEMIEFLENEAYGNKPGRMPAAAALEDIARHIAAERQRTEGLVAALREALPVIAMLSRTAASAEDYNRALDVRVSIEAALAAAETKEQK